MTNIMTQATLFMSVSIKFRQFIRMIRFNRDVLNLSKLEKDFDIHRNLQYTKTYHTKPKWKNPSEETQNFTVDLL